MNALTRIGLLVWLSLGLGGCLLSDDVCTSADTTYSCCVKQHLGNASQCNALEAEVGALKPTVHPSTPRTHGTAAAVGTMAAAAALSSDGEIFSEKLRAAVEKVLQECAVQAHEAVNRRRLGGDPTREQCEEILKWDPNGKPVTRAMQLGEEKHAEAALCAKARLHALIPGRFSLEQRYRINPTTGQLEWVTHEQYQELLKTGQSRSLRGTVKPDVVLHSGTPTKVQMIYDFKFPCLRETLPKWTIYEEGHPYAFKNQGEVYKEIFKVKVRRITPWEMFQ